MKAAERVSFRAALSTPGSTGDGFSSSARIVVSAQQQPVTSMNWRLAGGEASRDPASRGNRLKRERAPPKDRSGAALDRRSTNACSSWRPNTVFLFLGLRLQLKGTGELAAPASTKEAGSR